VTVLVGSERGGVDAPPFPYQFVIRGNGMSQKILTQLTAKYSVTPSGCWAWDAGKGRGGYGQMWIPEQRSNRPAHRISYELHIGSIPDGMLVCHTCDEPSCINPAHLFLGTHADNSADMVAKNRQQRAVGENANGSRLTESQIKSIRSDTRAQWEIASEYGVHQSQISKIKSRKHWRHI